MSKPFVLQFNKKSTASNEALRYISTRADRSKDENYCSAAQAIIRGLADDGGLYLPESVPQFTREELKQLPFMTYNDTACLVLGKYLDFSEEEIRRMVTEAYSSFDDKEAVKIEPLRGGDMAVLELWHGPSCAFKDMALQLLPRLLTASLKLEGVEDQIWILTATSGDTGKAALEGFKDVPGTRITVFYPDGGVSAIQKAQMVRQLGNNVDIIAVEGNFDDAQSGVKRIFSNKELAKKLAEKKIRLSSANSINWGRLLPQIVYYVYTATRLYDKVPVDFTVPTGNFGDILAGYYAKLMGAPVGHLICASNANNVLTDFMASGTYNRNRPFYKTASPSMDILVSSNLERLLYLKSGCDSSLVASLMEDLKTKGSYTIPAELLSAIHEDFSACFCSDEDTTTMINASVQVYDYLMDPHTAVGCYAAQLYLQEKRSSLQCASGIDVTEVTETGDLPDMSALEAAEAAIAPMVLLSTASPFKFADTVLEALGMPREEGFDAMYRLSKVSGMTVPLGLAALKDLPERFNKVLKTDELETIFD